MESSRDPRETNDGNTQWGSTDSPLSGKLIRAAQIAEREQADATAQIAELQGMLEQLRREKEELRRQKEESDRSTEQLRRQKEASDEGARQLLQAKEAAERNAQQSETNAKQARERWSLNVLRCVPNMFRGFCRRRIQDRLLEEARTRRQAVIHDIQRIMSLFHGHTLLEKYFTANKKQLQKYLTIAAFDDPHGYATLVTNAVPSLLNCCASSIGDLVLLIIEIPINFCKAMGSAMTGRTTIPGYLIGFVSGLLRGVAAVLIADPCGGPDKQGAMSDRKWEIEQENRGYFGWRRDQCQGIIPRLLELPLPYFRWVASLLWRLIFKPLGWCIHAFQEVLLTPFRIGHRNRGFALGEAL
jgi:hypothetical protein